jgi:hypothetical protein
MATRIVEFPQATIPPRGKAEAPRPVLARSKMVHLTADELLAVLKVARERSARDWSMILIAYRHGMRASELCGLNGPCLGGVFFSSSCAFVTVKDAPHLWHATPRVSWVSRG